MLSCVFAWPVIFHTREALLVAVKFMRYILKFAMDDISVILLATRYFKVLKLGVGCHPGFQLIIMSMSLNLCSGASGTQANSELFLH
jgi:hypothetical protein